MSLSKIILTRCFIFIFLSLAAFNVSAQQTVAPSSDSLRFAPVKLTDIPIRSAETLMKTRKVLNSLISAEEISTIRSDNDSILNLVEAKMAGFPQQDEFKSIRYLKNRILQLRIQKDIVKSEIDRISGIIGNLERSIRYFADEKRIWTNTRNRISRSSFSGTITQRIDMILATLDSAEVEVSLQIEAMLFTLDRSSEVSLRLDQIVDNLNTQVEDQQKKLLRSDLPGIFNLDRDQGKFDVALAFKNYLSSEWYEIRSFVVLKADQFIAILLFFVILLFVLIKYRDRIISIKDENINYHKKRLAIILSKPISVSVLLMLMVVLITIPNRPLGFRDLLSVVVVVPLFVILRELLDKKMLLMVVGFALLMLLNIVFEIFPVENSIFRYFLVFVALAKTGLVIWFLFFLLGQMGYSKLVHLSFKVIGYLFLVMSLSGLYGAVTGNIIIAISFTTAISVLVIVSAILYSSLIVVIGLLVFLIDAKGLQKVNFIRNNGMFLKKRATAILNTLAVIYILVVLMKQLNIWIFVRNNVTEFLDREWVIGQVDFTVGEILVFFLVIYLSMVIARIIQVVLEDDVLRRMPLSKGLPHTISTIIKYTLITVGVMIAVSAAGMELSSLAVIIGAFGVGIGFGLQNIFNNLVSGLILLFERPLQIGDTIEVGTLIGKVKSIGIRSSNIQTFDGAEVIVPNGQLISNEVINWTLSDQQRRIEAIIGVSYSSDPHFVQKLLMGILEEHEEIMQDPKPSVFFHELADSSLNFRMLFWTRSYSEWQRIRSEIIFKAFDVLKENDIEIPFPQRDLHLKNAEQLFANDPGVPKENPEQ